MTRFYYLMLMLVLSAVTFTPLAQAGKLDDFEDSIGQQSEDSESPEGDDGKHGMSCNDDSLELGCLVFRRFMEGIYQILYIGGASSLSRVRADGEVWPREFGEPSISFVRLDAGYQYISRRIHAYDLRAEAGYALLALGYHGTWYREKSPDDTLDLNRIYGLLRLSYGPYVEVDLGLGSLKVDGNNRRSYFYVTTPVLVHASPRIGFEFRPAWASNVSDYDFGILLKSRYVALKFGYRKVSANSQSLSGAYSGISLYY